MFARLAPGPVVRWFARPYVAGDSLEAALALAYRRHREDGLLTTLDLLGEDVTSRAKVEANLATYKTAVKTLGTDPRFQDVRPTISLKPSAFTTGTKAEAQAPIEELAAHAREHEVSLTIDMEDRDWTDPTLEWSIDLFQRGYDVGTVLQTRLFRTEQDIERIPEGMRLRLVIGIYPEPDDVALTRKRPMKERMVAYARALLARGVFVEFATHDETYVEQFAREVAPAAPERCEVQMLLGVPRATVQRRLREGDFGVKLPVRLYVPFAIGWDDATAYLRRRMRESPSVMWLVLRNFFRGGGG